MFTAGTAPMYVVNTEACMETLLAIALQSKG